MFVDLLSTTNYVSFNIKLAEMFGLHAAIHISELINIYEKAARKNKLILAETDEYFVVDRKYLSSRSTLTTEEQKQIEEQVIKLKIIKRLTSSANTIHIDLNALAGVSEVTDETVKENLQKVSTVTKKRSKSEVIMETLKDSIKTTNNELRNAYNEWIDAVYAKQGWMSKAAVKAGEKTVDDFANHDLDVALQVVGIAAMNGYRDMKWAVTSYIDNSNKVPVKKQTQRSANVLSTEVY